MSIRIKVALKTGAVRLPGSLGLAYAAGLFDGEGCVHIARQLKSTTRRGHIFRLVVSVAQNHLETLIDFQNFSGFEGRIYQVRRQGPANRDSFTLNYDGKRAAGLLEVLTPYLRRKKDEALVALRFQSECQINKHFGPGGCPDDVWEERESLYHKLRKLK